MSRAYLVLSSDAIRRRAVEWISRAPDWTRIEFKAPRRTLPQNSRMWAMLTDVSAQLTHCGRQYDPEDWKKLFMDLLNREMRVVPNLDGTGMVDLGTSSSDLSVEEMSDLIEIILAFGAQHGVVWQDERKAA